MCQLTNFEDSDEEMESKIRIYVEKLRKIGLFGNFDFWSKVNAKGRSQPKSKLMVSDKLRGWWWARADVAFVDVIWWHHGWQHHRFQCMVGVWRRSQKPRRHVGRIWKRWRHVLVCVNAINSWTSWVLQIVKQWGRQGGACGHDLTWVLRFWRRVGRFHSC